MIFFQKKPKPPRAFDIPRGAFTYDSAGRILVGSVPMAWLEEFGPVLVKALREAFTGAEEKGLTLSEIALHYAGARIIARDLRGGGIVYVMPPATKP